MVRAGAVVAQRFGGVAAHEDRTGMADLRQPALRVSDRQLQVLRRNAVGNHHGFIHVGHLDQCATALQRGADDLGTLHGRQQAVDAGLDGVEEGGIRADQDRLGIFVVLGLGEQVHGDPVRIGLAIAHHQDFRRAGNHVDAALTEHMALGGGHIDVAGADDLVALRHALGTVGQCGYGLCATDAEHAVNAGHAGSGQYQLVQLATRGRHHHHDFRHTGDLGRDGVHQHGGWIGGLATRHVQAGAIQRSDLLAEDSAVGFGVGPGVLLLAFVIQAHALGGLLQRSALGIGDAGQRQFQTGTVEDQLGHAGGFHLVETTAQFDQCGIALLADGLDDVQHALVDGIIGHAFPAEQMVHLAGELRVGGIESAKGYGCGHEGPLWHQLGQNRAGKPPACGRRAAHPGSVSPAVCAWHPAATMDPRQDPWGTSVGQWRFSQPDDAAPPGAGCRSGSGCWRAASSSTPCSPPDAS